MINHRFMVRKAAVLGAGVMGAQIAAHLVNGNIETLLFELPDEKSSDPSAPAAEAIEKLKKLEPAPLSLAAKAACFRVMHDRQHGENTDAVGDKVGGIFGADDSFAQIGDQKCFQRVEYAGIAFLARNQLDQMHITRRIKKMDAAIPVTQLFRQRLRELIDG